LNPAAQDTLSVAARNLQFQLWLAAWFTAGGKPLRYEEPTDLLRRLAALPDSACFVCVFAPGFIRAQLLEARRQDRNVAPLVERFSGLYMTPTEGFRALVRGRVNERLGNREKAIAAYRFVVDVWRNPDPELQPFVTEALAALKRLTGEPR
jgi:hypothetical protein